MSPGLKNTVYRVIWLGLLCLPAFVGFSACGSEPEPPPAVVASPAADTVADTGVANAPDTGVPTLTPQPTATLVPTPSPAPTATPMPTPTPTLLPSPTPPPSATPTAIPPASPAPTNAVVPAGAGDFAPGAIGPETRWGDLFDAFNEGEQSCIRKELGDKQLAEVLARPVLPPGETEEWQVSVLRCVAPEKAADLFYSGLTSSLGDLADENRACIRQLLARTDIAALAAATLPDAPPEQSLPLLAFYLGLAVCVPELAAGGPAAPSAIP